MIGKYSSTRLKKAYENTILSQVEVGVWAPPAFGRRRPHIVLVRPPSQGGRTSSSGQPGRLSDGPKRHWKMVLAVGCE
jgi:hypothetical protein